MVTGEIVWFVVGIAGFVAAVVVMGRLRSSRRSSIRLIADERGWSFRDTDPAVEALPLDLIHATVHRRVENVVHADVGGRVVTVFDLTDPRRASMGDDDRPGRNLTCAITPLPGRFPHLVIEPAEWITPFPPPGTSRVRFESGDFNEAFDVRTADPVAGNTVVDARLMAWLLEGAERVRFELKAGLVMAATTTLPARRIPAFAEAVAAFVERIPRVAVEAFGSPER